MKTDALDITLITTPKGNLFETRDTTRIGSNAVTSEKLPLSKLLVNENEEIPSNTEIVKSEGKEKLYTRVLNETTLRIFCQKNSNADTITQDLPNLTNSSINTQEDAPDKDTVKDTIELTLLQGFFCICYFCYFFVVI